jgi:hypothetical protein
MLGVIGGKDSVMDLAEHLASVSVMTLLLIARPTTFSYCSILCNALFGFALLSLLANADMKPTTHV